MFVIPAYDDNFCWEKRRDLGRSSLVFFLVLLVSPELVAPSVQSPKFPFEYVTKSYPSRSRDLWTGAKHELALSYFDDAALYVLDIALSI